MKQASLQDQQHCPRCSQKNYCRGDRLCWCMAKKATASQREKLTQYGTQHCFCNNCLTTATQ